MTVKLVHREVSASDAGHNQCWAKIYKRTEGADVEYRVKFYVHAIWQSRSDYYTNDLDDAKRTAATECWRGFAATSI